MTEPTKDQPQKVTTQRLTNTAFSFKQTGTLLAALELDLFSKVADGVNKIPEMAKSLDIPLSATDKLVTVCAAMGLLEKRDGSFYNTPDVDRYLVRGRPSHYGDFLMFQMKGEYDGWKDIVTRLRQPTSTAGVYQLLTTDANAARGLTVAGYNSSIAAGRKLAREFDFSPYSLFLDLGGGSGCYSIAAAEKYPNLQAIVFDFANVCVVAEEFVAQAGLSDRISTHPGDFMVDEFPQGADLVGLIGNLQAYSLDETEFVIKKAFQALAPGGGMIVIDYMLNDDRTGPLEAALRQLDTVPASAWVKTVAEFSELMRRAGAVDIVASDFILGSMGRVTGKKPR